VVSLQNTVESNTDDINTFQSSLSAKADDYDVVSPLVKTQRTLVAFGENPVELSVNYFRFPIELTKMSAHFWFGKLKPKMKKVVLLRTDGFKVKKPWVQNSKYSRCKPFINSVRAAFASIYGFRFQFSLL
jgi:hypothetical protein